MTQEAHSFWTDIKMYEDILAQDPDSYCFVQLSELYRKIGLLDDAIFVAVSGVEAHPSYVDGHLALGMAYFDKGQMINSRNALEQVVAMAPENLVAQKQLSKIYLELNDLEKAQRALETVHALAPDDVECRLSLEALARGGVPALEMDAYLENEEDLEEAEILEDDLPDVEMLDESSAAPVFDSESPFGEESPQELSRPKDPLTTVTLAEIYLAQGFYDQALQIFRELSAATPENDELHRRIVEIEALKAQAHATPVTPDAIPAATGLGEPTPLTASQSSVRESVAVTSDDLAVAALEEWLERIERRRACR